MRDEIRDDSRCFCDVGITIVSSVGEKRTCRVHTYPEGIETRIPTGG